MRKSKGVNMSIPESLFKKYDLGCMSKKEESGEDLSDTAAQKEVEPTTPVMQTRAKDSNGIFTHGREELKTPHMKKAIHDKNKQIHAVLDTFHGKVVKNLQRVSSDRKATLMKACKSLEPLCKEIGEDGKLVEKQQKHVGELMKLVKEQASLMETLKQRQLKNVSAAQKLLAEIKQELDGMDASAVKDYTGMTTLLKEDIERAISQMTVENAKFFIEKFCTSLI